MKYTKVFYEFLTSFFWGTYIPFLQRLLLGTPSIFAGAPSTWGEKLIISLGYFFKKNAWLSLSRYCLSPLQFLLLLPRTAFDSSSSSKRLILPHSHFRIFLVTSWTCLSPATFFFFLVWFFFFLSHEPVAVKRSHEPPSTVEGASSASTVEVSTTVICFRHWCRSREAWRSLWIRWSVNNSDIVYGSPDP